jgi:hypothetical protein
MRPALVQLILALSSFAQSGDPQLLLNQVRKQVFAVVKSAPRYSCTEIIERSWYHNRRPESPGCDTDRAPRIGPRTLVETDRLRLDVAVGAGQEMFSWHGEKAYQTENINSLVSAGPIHSGSYFGFLSSVFLEGSAQINYIGLRSEDSHEVAVFQYTMPRSESTFETETDAGPTVMGYHGEFTVDPVSHSIQRLAVIAEESEIPESASFCSLHLDARYQVVSLNGNAFRLPAAVEMTLLDRNREVKRTSTRYQACHEFLAESQLRFDDSPAIAASTGAAPHPLKELPPGLRVAIRITSNTNPANSWGGDPVTGELSDDLTDEHGTVLAAKGTFVQGRLLRMETLFNPRRAYTAVVQFDQLADYSLRLKSVIDTSSPGSALMPRRIQLDNPPISNDLAACRFRLNEQQASLKGALTHWVTR